MNSAKPSRRKLVSLALCAALLCVVALGLVAPLAASITEARDTIAAEEERLRGLRAKRVDLALLDSELKATRARAAEAPLFAETPTSAAAWEQLEAILRDLASQHEAAIGSTRMLRLEDDGGLKAVRAEIELSVPRAKLTPLVAAIERHAPSIFIEKLRLVAGEEREGDDRIRVTGAVRMLAAIAPPAAAAGARK